MTASSAHLVRDGPLDTNSCFVEERSSGLSPLQTANHFRPPRASTPASKGWRFLKSIGHFSGKRRASSRDELFQDKHSDGGYGQDSDAIDSGHRTSSLFGTASSLEEGDRSTDCLRQASSNDDSNLRLAQLGRELEMELAQSEEGTALVPEPRHVKFATVMAKNLRRDTSSRSLTSKQLEPSVANGHMTQEERRELIRAQREVITNLQKDYVVTVVRPGDEPVPYKRQGNPAVNTPNSVRQRLALKKKPLIQEITNEYWCFPGLNSKGSSEMSKESYVKLNRKLHLALVRLLIWFVLDALGPGAHPNVSEFIAEIVPRCRISPEDVRFARWSHLHRCVHLKNIARKTQIPDTSDEEARRAAEVDWVRDTANWGGGMTQEAFASSMFELADIWTEDIGEEEYTAFLWLLLETITDTTVVPPSFKPDREIECIIDKDLSDASTRIGQALIDSGARDEKSPALDMSTVAAILAGNTAGRGTLSPHLKEKHIQRLRALRQRLQALKQLRNPPGPETKDNKDDDTGFAERSTHMVAPAMQGTASGWPSVHRSEHETLHNLGATSTDSSANRAGACGISDDARETASATERNRPEKSPSTPDVCKYNASPEDDTGWGARGSLDFRTSASFDQQGDTSQVHDRESSLESDGARGIGREILSDRGNYSDGSGPSRRESGVLRDENLEGEKIAGAPPSRSQPNLETEEGMPASSYDVKDRIHHHDERSRLENAVLIQDVRASNRLVLEASNRDELGVIEREQALNSAVNNVGEIIPKHIVGVTSADSSADSPAGHVIDTVGGSRATSSPADCVGEMDKNIGHDKERGSGGDDMHAAGGSDEASGRQYGEHNSFKDDDDDATDDQGARTIDIAANDRSREFRSIGDNSDGRDGSDSIVNAEVKPSEGQDSAQYAANITEPQTEMQRSPSGAGGAVNDCGTLGSLPVNFGSGAPTNSESVTGQENTTKVHPDDGGSHSLLVSGKVAEQVASGVDGEPNTRNGNRAQAPDRNDGGRPEVEVHGGSDGLGGGDNRIGAAGTSAPTKDDDGINVPDAVRDHRGDYDGIVSAGQSASIGDGSNKERQGITDRLHGHAVVDRVREVVSSQKIQQSFESDPSVRGALHLEARDVCGKLGLNVKSSASNGGWGSSSPPGEEDQRAGKETVKRSSTRPGGKAKAGSQAMDRVSSPAIVAASRQDGKIIQPATHFKGKSSEGGRPSASSDAIREKKSNFRPAGERGGWDGISGTTDEKWEEMIQEAKEERKRLPNRTATGRGPSRRKNHRRTTPEAGKGVAVSETSVTTSRNSSILSTGSRSGGGVAVQAEDRQGDQPANGEGGFVRGSDDYGTQRATVSVGNGGRRAATAHALTGSKRKQPAKPIQEGNDGTSGVQSAHVVSNIRPCSREQSPRHKHRDRLESRVDPSPWQGGNTPAIDHASRSAIGDPTASKVENQAAVPTTGVVCSAIASATAGEHYLGAPVSVDYHITEAAYQGTSGKIDEGFEGEIASRDGDRYYSIGGQHRQHGGGISGFSHGETSAKDKQGQVTHSAATLRGGEAEKARGGSSGAAADDTLDRLDAVLQKHSMSLEDIFDGKATVLRAHDANSLTSQGRPTGEKAVVHGVGSAGTFQEDRGNPAVTACLPPLQRAGRWLSVPSVVGSDEKVSTNVESVRAPTHASDAPAGAAIATTVHPSGRVGLETMRIADEIAAGRHAVDTLQSSVEDAAQSIVQASGSVAGSSGASHVIPVDATGRFELSTNDSQMGEPGRIGSTLVNLTERLPSTRRSPASHDQRLLAYTGGGSQPERQRHFRDEKQEQDQGHALQQAPWVDHAGNIVVKSASEQVQTFAWDMNETLLDVGHPRTSTSPSQEGDKITSTAHRDSAVVQLNTGDFSAGGTGDIDGKTRSGGALQTGVSEDGNGDKRMFTHETGRDPMWPATAVNTGRTASGVIELDTFPVRDGSAPDGNILESLWQTELQSAQGQDSAAAEYSGVVRVASRQSNGTSVATALQGRAAQPLLFGWRDDMPHEREDEAKRVALVRQDNVEHGSPAHPMHVHSTRSPHGSKITVHRPFRESPDEAEVVVGRASIEGDGGPTFVVSGGNLTARAMPYHGNPGDWIQTNSDEGPHGNGGTLYGTFHMGPIVQAGASPRGESLPTGGGEHDSGDSLGVNHAAPWADRDYLAATLCGVTEVLDTTLRPTPDAERNDTIQTVPNTTDISDTASRICVAYLGQQAPPPGDLERSASDRPSIGGVDGRCRRKCDFAVVDGANNESGKGPRSQHRNDPLSSDQSPSVPEVVTSSPYSTSARHTAKPSPAVSPSRKNNDSMITRGHHDGDDSLCPAYQGKAGGEGNMSSGDDARLSSVENFGVENARSEQNAVMVGNGMQGCAVQGGEGGGRGVQGRREQQGVQKLLMGDHAPRVGSSEVARETVAELATKGVGNGMISLDIDRSDNLDAFRGVMREVTMKNSTGIPATRPPHLPVGSVHENDEANRQHFRQKGYARHDLLSRNVPKPLAEAIKQGTVRDLGSVTFVGTDVGQIRQMDGSAVPLLEKSASGQGITRTPRNAGHGGYNKDGKSACRAPERGNPDDNRSASSGRWSTTLQSLGSEIAHTKTVDGKSTIGVALNKQAGLNAPRLRTMATVPGTVSNATGMKMGQGYDTCRLQSKTQRGGEASVIKGKGGGLQDDVGRAPIQDCVTTAESTPEAIAHGLGVVPVQRGDLQSDHMEKEKLAMAVASRIADADGTQYVDALAEVRKALMGTNISELHQSSRATKEAQGFSATPTESGDHRVRKRHLRRDESTKDVAAPQRKEASTEARVPRRERVRKRLRSSLPGAAAHPVLPDTPIPTSLSARAKNRAEVPVAQGTEPKPAVYDSEVSNPNAGDSSAVKQHGHKKSREQYADNRDNRADRIPGDERPWLPGGGILGWKRTERSRGDGDHTDENVPNRAAHVGGVNLKGWTEAGEIARPSRFGHRADTRNTAGNNSQGRTESARAAGDAIGHRHLAPIEDEGSEMKGGPGQRETGREGTRQTEIEGLSAGTPRKDNRDKRRPIGIRDDVRELYRSKGEYLGVRKAAAVASRPHAAVPNILGKSDGRSDLLSQKSLNDHFSGDRPGDRYYLAPHETGNIPRRPRASHGAGWGTRPRGDTDKGRSRSLSERHDAGDAGQSSSTSDLRSKRASLPSGCADPEESRDSRPMFGSQSTVPPWGYGWRGGFPVISGSIEDDSLPYYLDRKQVYQFLPDDGLPPWRSPAPGEPGWDPILNYCELKQDEEEINKERKRRDYLCRRRDKGRGGDSIGNAEDCSSLADNSDGSSRSRLATFEERTARAVAAASAATVGGSCRADQETKADPKDGSDYGAHTYNDADVAVDADDYDKGESNGGILSSEVSIATRVNSQRLLTIPVTVKGKPDNFSSPARKKAAFVVGANVGVSSVEQNNVDILTSPRSLKYTTLPESSGDSVTARVVGVRGNTGKSQSVEVSFTEPAGRTERPRNSGIAGCSRFLSPLLSGDGNSPSGMVDLNVQDGAPPEVRSATNVERSTVAVRSSKAQQPRPKHHRSSITVTEHPHRQQCITHGTLRRGSNSPLQSNESLVGSLDYERRRDISLQQNPENAAGSHRGDHGGTSHEPTAPLSVPSHATADGKSSQDRYLQRHKQGRSRLAPATRTAGGRWGSKHGHLEALNPGDESVPPSRVSQIGQWASGPWVLDIDPASHGEIIQDTYVRR